MLERFKERIPLVSVGMLCLAAGLILLLFTHPPKGDTLNLVHFVGGFLIGISLAVNLVAASKAWRKRRSTSV